MALLDLIPSVVIDGLDDSSIRTDGVSVDNAFAEDINGVLDGFCCVVSLLSLPSPPI